MQIEAGKFYRTRDGQKVGPMNGNDGNPSFPFTDPRSLTWRKDGTHCFTGGCGDDLIAEWPDEHASPVRTITRKEIVPGTYGVLEIGTVASGSSKIPISTSGFCSADELDAAASLLTQIAAVLRENQ